MDCRNGRRRNPIALIEDNRIVSLYLMGYPSRSSKSAFCARKGLIPIHRKQT